MSLFRKYGESLLGQPIGIEEARVRNANVQGTFQNSSRYRRVARRGYREAMRNGDWQGAAKALDWLETKGESMGSGIEPAGMRMTMAEERAGQPNRGGVVQPLHPFTTLGSPAAVAAGASQPPPGTPNQSSNLNQRLGLFSQMKDYMGNGGDANVFWEDAKKLGVSPAGFGNAMERAKQEASYTSSNFGGAPSSPTPAPTSTGMAQNDTLNTNNLYASNPPPNPNSPDLSERLGAQGRAPGLFDQINLV